MKTSYSKAIKVGKFVLPDEILLVGVNMTSKKKISLGDGRTSKKILQSKFRKEFGTSQDTLAVQWYDIHMGRLPDEQTPTDSEASISGLQQFLTAHHFLWAYPKNAEVLADHLGICEKYARGEMLWKWVAR